MKNYDFVPDRPNYEHPDVCGEGNEPGEPEDDSECSSADVEANEREGQATNSEPNIETPTEFINRALKRLPWFPGILTPIKRENDATVNVDAALDVPADAEEGYCDWERERDRIQNERDAEEMAWSKQAQLQAEGDYT